jgi:hypothetical protein
MSGFCRPVFKTHSMTIMIFITYLYYLDRQAGEGDGGEEDGGEEEGSEEEGGKGGNQ